VLARGPERPYQAQARARRGLGRDQTRKAVSIPHLQGDTGQSPQLHPLRLAANQDGQLRGEEVKDVVAARAGGHSAPWKLQRDRARHRSRRQRRGQEALEQPGQAAREVTAARGSAGSSGAFPSGRPAGLPPGSRRAARGSTAPRSRGRVLGRQVGREPRRRWRRCPATGVSAGLAVSVHAARERPLLLASPRPGAEVHGELRCGAGSDAGVERLTGELGAPERLSVVGSLGPRSHIHVAGKLLRLLGASRSLLVGPDALPVLPARSRLALVAALFEVPILAGFASAAPDRRPRRGANSQPALQGQFSTGLDSDPHRRELAWQPGDAGVGSRDGKRFRPRRRGRRAAARQRHRTIGLPGRRGLGQFVELHPSRQRPSTRAPHHAVAYRSRPAVCLPDAGDDCV